jgi:aspartyl-tRNA(Asn)/glutamyl-tRNA(Gln) amidotransferase subunit A
VLPTTPNVAPRFADIADAVGFNRENGRALRNTSLFNFLDRCAISLPVDAGGGLPVGLMLVGETMEDRRLLGLARAVEGGLAG